MKASPVLWLVLLLCLSGPTWGQHSLYEKYAEHKEWNVAYLQDFQFDTAVGPMDVILLQAHSRHSWKKMLQSFRIHCSKELLRHQTLTYFADRSDPSRRPPMQICNGQRRVQQAHACLVFVATDTKSITLFFPRSEKQSLQIIQYQLRH